MTGLIKDHRGRVVDAKGDNVLAEFSSVVGAVRCAVQVQKELTGRNSELPETKGIAWREKAVQRNPKNLISRKILCSIYSLAGLMDEARAQAKEIMRLNPHFSVDQVARTEPQKIQAVKKQSISLEEPKHYYHFLGLLAFPA